MTSNKINNTATINHLLNTACPPLIIMTLVFMNFGFSDWIPYAVTALTIFVAKYNFNVGYAVGYCEKNKLI